MDKIKTYSQLLAVMVLISAPARMAIATSIGTREGSCLNRLAHELSYSQAGLNGKVPETWEEHSQGLQKLRERTTWKAPREPQIVELQEIYELIPGGVPYPSPGSKEGDGRIHRIVAIRKFVITRQMDPSKWLPIGRFMKPYRYGIVQVDSNEFGRATWTEEELQKIFNKAGVDIGKYTQHDPLYSEQWVPKEMRMKGKDSTYSILLGDLLPQRYFGYEDPSNPPRVDEQGAGQRGPRVRDSPRRPFMAWFVSGIAVLILSAFFVSRNRRLKPS